MRRSTPPSRTHLASYGSLLQAHRFPMAEVQSTQRQVYDSLALDVSADNCKTANNPVIAVVPL